VAAVLVVVVVVAATVEIWCGWLWYCV